MVIYRTAWHGYGVSWFSMLLCDMVLFGIALHSMMLHRKEYFGKVPHGIVVLHGYSPW